MRIVAVVRYCLNFKSRMQVFPISKNHGPGLDSGGAMICDSPALL